MAVIIKKELDSQTSVQGGGQSTWTWNFSHIKVDVTNEAQVLNTVKMAGLSQMEAMSFLRIVNDFPKATNDNEKQHILVIILHFFPNSYTIFDLFKKKCVKTDYFIIIKIGKALHDLGW